MVNKGLQWWIEEWGKAAERHEKLQTKLALAEGEDYLMSKVIKAVMEVHQFTPHIHRGVIAGNDEPFEYTKYYCSCRPGPYEPWPCPTIQAIEKVLA